MIAEVALPIPVRKLFSYRIPKELENKISIGQRVIIPFGKRKEKGYVVSINETTGQSYLKDISSVIDDIPIITPELLKLAEIISNNYVCSSGEVLDSIFSVNINKTDTILPPEQMAFTQRISTGIPSKLPKHNKSGIFLLTNLSRKERTEVYINLLSESLNYGECILLVPEIFFITDFIKRLSDVFGNAVNIFHSGITPKQRYINWMNTLNNKMKITIGTRLALFMPFRKLKTIIIEDETDQSYKNQQKPMYTAVDIAMERSKLTDSIVVLGSRIPSLESYYYYKTKKYRLLENKSGSKDSFEKPEFNVKIIDLKETKTVFSNELKTEIEQRLAKNEISVIFLNRKGYINVIFCKNCSTTRKCPECGISLVYHEKESLLKCRYCSFTEKFNNVCTNCESKNLRFLSSGIEKIENELKIVFPQLRVMRIDSNTIKTEKDIHHAVEEIAADRIDLLIGTQSLLQLEPKINSADKLDNPADIFRKITLLAIFDVDTLLHLPDFRSAERAFQLVYKLSDILNKKSTILIQTRNRDHYILNALEKLDWRKFYNSELVHRKELGYPPFNRLINIVIHSRNKNNVLNEAQKMSSFLQETFKNRITILGPVEPYHIKLRDEYRQQILLKVEQDRFEEVGTKLGTYKPEHNARITFDVNPYELT